MTDKAKCTTCNDNGYTDKEEVRTPDNPGRVCAGSIWYFCFCEEGKGMRETSDWLEECLHVK